MGQVVVVVGKAAAQGVEAVARLQVEVVGRDVAVGGAGGEEAAGGDEEVHEGLLVEVVPAAVVAAVDERVGPVVLGDEVAVFGQVVRSAVAPGVEELVAQAEAVAPGAELVGGIEVVAVAVLGGVQLAVAAGGVDGRAAGGPALGRGAGKERVERAGAEGGGVGVPLAAAPAGGVVAHAPGEAGPELHEGAVRQVALETEVGGPCLVPVVEGRGAVAERAARVAEALLPQGVAVVVAAVVPACAAVDLEIARPVGGALVFPEEAGARFLERGQARAAARSAVLAPRALVRGALVLCRVGQPGVGREAPALPELFAKPRSSQ